MKHDRQWRAIGTPDSTRPDSERPDSTRPGWARGGIARENEFPDGEVPAPARRDVLRLMGASLALAGLGACSPRPEKSPTPPVEASEGWVPGQPQYYATALVLDGVAQPVLATCNDGRPTKLEGNPHHPACRGATDAFTQAAVLDVYDPDRSKAPLKEGEPATWAAFQAEIFERRKTWATNGGARLRIIVEPTTSPTLLGQLRALAKEFPALRVHVLEPPRGEFGRGTELAFSAPLQPIYRLDAARFVASFDDDLLGPGPRQTFHVSSWAAQRARHDITLAVAQSTPTLTGARAGHRLAIPSGRIPALLASIAARFGVGDAVGDAFGDIGDAERAWADRVAAGLAAARGQALVTAGATQPPDSAALAYRLNHRLGAIGRTLVLVERDEFPPTQSLSELVRDAAEGRIDEMVFLGCNPLHTVPRRAGLAAALRRVANSVHLGLHYDETAAACRWHLPLAHSLESWSDARSADGLVTLIQPMIRPLYASRTLHQVADMLRGKVDPDFGESVHDTWRTKLGIADDDTRRAALIRGFIENSAPAAATADPAATALSKPPVRSGLEAVFVPDSKVWDGRFANNAWLQEFPAPITKISWGNAVAVSPELAARRGLKNGDHVKVSHDGRAVVAPSWIMAGQPDRTVTLFVGQGRRRAGRIGNGIGYDAAVLRQPGSWRLDGIAVERAAGHTALVTTQTHHSMEGRDFVRLVADAGETLKPDAEHGRSLYAGWPQPSPAWAMVIDLDLCMGCNACGLACQAENNVPVVGPQQVAMGREMHWLRIDRYYAGEPGDPEIYFQPVPCMQCEKAPCEMGCPVHATVHDRSGINEMVYNRCIGTRTCSSYCPYKVRRFNWYAYSDLARAPTPAQRNPNVTVRERGVMEKCTYCIQRIAAARVRADIEMRSIRDGEVVTACQAACPSRAISFGDMADSKAKVAALRNSGRNYALIPDIDTRPRTTYLARVADGADK